MAFLDKLGSITKNISEKTNDMLETAKLNSKINEEKSKIASLKTKIGEYYWAQSEAGAVLDDEPAGFCAAIRESLSAIVSIELEIQKIKAASQPASAPQPVQTAYEAPAAAGVTCANCGTAVSGEGVRFCPECGSPLEAPPPQEA